MGFDNYTRFHNTVGSDVDAVVWTPSYTGGDTVPLTAPAGLGLTMGTGFYVNLRFTADTVDTVNFTGDWTTNAPTRSDPVLCRWPVWSF